MEYKGRSALVALVAISATVALSGCSATAGTSDPFAAKSVNSHTKSSPSAGDGEPATTPSAPAVVANINTSQVTPDQAAKCAAFGVNSAVQTVVGDSTLTYGDPSSSIGDENASGLYGCIYTNAAGGNVLVVRLTYANQGDASDKLSGIKFHLNGIHQLSIPWSDSAVSGDFGVGVAAAQHGNEVIEVSDASKGSTGTPEGAASVLEAVTP